jgi:hypothetical protein
VVGPGAAGERQARPPFERLAIPAFVVALLGLLVAPLILGIAAFVLGLVSVRHLTREPGAYRGRGLAIAGMVIGAVNAVVGLLYTLSVVNDTTPG